MRDIFHFSPHWDDNSEELSQAECVLGNRLGSSCELGDPLLCVWALAQSQICPFREDGPEAKCRLSCPTGAKDQQPMARQLIAQRCQWLDSKIFLLEVYRVNILRPVETRIINLRSLFQLPRFLSVGKYKTLF